MDVFSVLIVWGGFYLVLSAGGMTPLHSKVAGLLMVGAVGVFGLNQKLNEIQRDLQELKARR